MATTTAAVRAQHFMRQCRCNRATQNSFKTTKRTVSSSHLAPSNFSRPLRLRDEINNQSRQHNIFLDPAPEYAHTATSSSSNTASLPHTNPLYANSRTSRSPPITTAPPIPAGFLNFIKYRIFNFPPPRAQHKPPPFNVLNNPYKARKQWPPDFRNLHPKQQFHFEKTFRRRAVIKAHSQRYNWNRYVRLVQQSLIVLTVVYFLFIADPYHKEGGGTPVDGFRAWFFAQFAKNEHIPRDLRTQAQELEAYYSRNAGRNTREIEEVTQRARDTNMASSEAVLEARGKLKMKNND